MGIYFLGFQLMGGVGGNLRIRLRKFEDLLNNLFFVVFYFIYRKFLPTIFVWKYSLLGQFWRKFQIFKTMHKMRCRQDFPNKYTPMQAEYKHKSLRLPVPDVKTVNIAPNSMSPGWLHDSPWLQCPLSTSVDDIMISEWTY